MGRWCVGSGWAEGLVGGGLNGRVVGRHGGWGMVGGAWCIALSCLLCSGSFLTSPLIGTLSLALVAPLSITYDIVFEHVRNTMILHVYL